MTNKKEVGNLDEGYVTKSDEEMLALCTQMLEKFRASNMKPSQSMGVMWAGLKAMYAAWIHFGGKRESALGDLRHEYEEIKAVIMSERIGPGTKPGENN